MTNLSTTLMAFRVNLIPLLVVKQKQPVPAPTVGRWAQSVQQLTTGWTVRGSNSGGGEIFFTRPDRPWGPPSLLYNGYRVFTGGKAAGAWCWPPTREWVELYLYAPSRLLVACYRVTFTLREPTEIRLNAVDFDSPAPLGPSGGQQSAPCQNLKFSINISEPACVTSVARSTTSLESKIISATYLLCLFYSQSFICRN
jgi:hypothetical protein